MSEAQRQRELLAALFAGAAALPAGLREDGKRASRGLEAYRANAEAIAERALGSTFATVRAMLGDEDFRHLAREFWRAQPPARGDLGMWGEGFPAWIAAHAGLRAWPWLADGARLDLALHHSERAQDAELDAGSLTLLESADPSSLKLLLMPGTALLCSPWPIASIHRAHQLAGAAAEHAFAEVRHAIAEQRGEQAMVVRAGWRAAVVPLDALTAGWTQDLLAGIPLHDALMRAGEGFDFAAWLATALRESWLKAVSASTAPT